MKTTDILKDLDETTHDFLKVLSAFEAEQVNIVPFEGSWTAGQVAEHVLKSEAGLPDILLGPTAHEKRASDEKVAIINSIFLDFSTKMQAPSFIIPSEGPHDQQQLLASFTKKRSQIAAVAGTEDLTLTCMSFRFPNLGELTRVEWLSFIIAHSKRHTFQLRNIFEKVTEKVES
ncbi:DinB family protein [Dyadobacter pollutisoli]|uniref:DinB family protein n=1 Tax=Dyadobacter pollutisoli TaxID=2910158 RepID=A0A9E8NEJ1_9BACT|nr:DinB family protein [Dyadobacter pollutisoli]WAC14513.1 DinB family protein [Dyadobacter pollutisoli]